MLEIKKDIELSQFTTFKVGGPAKFFVVAKNEKDIEEAVKYAKNNDLKMFFLGGGSNVVVSDGGFDGLVIKLENADMDVKDGILECGAGAVLFETVKFSIEKGFEGFEWAAGIPGSFGGAIRGNAGAFGGDMSLNLESVRAFDVDVSEIKEFSKEECEFEYRSSIFKKQAKWVIISAKMKLSEGNKEESLAKVKEIVLKRITKQPQDFPSAGSFFQNPVVEDKDIIESFERDIGAKSREGRVAAGWLIDQLGLRGKRMGGAMISQKHANFLVNAENAKAEDIVILSSYIKQQVRDKMGIQLMEEPQYIGM